MGTKKKAKQNVDLERRVLSSPPCKIPAQSNLDPSQVQRALRFTELNQLWSPAALYMSSLHDVKEEDVGLKCFKRCHFAQLSYIAQMIAAIMPQDNELSFLCLAKPRDFTFVDKFESACMKLNQASGGKSPSAHRLARTRAKRQNCRCENDLSLIKIKSDEAPSKDIYHISSPLSFLPPCSVRKLVTESKIEVGDQRAENCTSRHFTWKEGTSNPGGITRAGESILLGPPFQFVFKDFTCVAQTIIKFGFVYGASTLMHFSTNRLQPPPPPHKKWPLSCSPCCVQKKKQQQPTNKTELCLVSTQCGVSSSWLRRNYRKALHHFTSSKALVVKKKKKAIKAKGEFWMPRYREQTKIKISVKYWRKKRIKK